MDEDFDNDILRGVLRKKPALAVVRAQDVGLGGRADPQILERTFFCWRNVASRGNGKTRCVIFPCEDNLPGRARASALAGVAPRWRRRLIRRCIAIGVISEQLSLYNQDIVRDFLPDC